VDWLIQVQHHLKLTQESLYLCVNLLDTVLHERDVDPDKLQLVGITSLLIATKLEEYYPAEIGKLLHLTENSYSRKDVLVMERVLFQVLKFQVDFFCCVADGHWPLFLFRDYSPGKIISSVLHSYRPNLLAQIHASSIEVR